MGTTFRLALMLTFALALGACKSSKQDKPQAETEPAPKCKSLIVSATKFDEDVAGAIDIEYIIQNGTELEIKYSYGGCGGEPIQLYWNGMFLKSQPPKMILMMVNEAPTLCKKLNVVTECFDFSTYLKTYAEITLVVDGYKEPVNIKRPE